MLPSVILAMVLAAVAIQLFRTAKVMVGKNELVVMIRSTRKGGTIEVLSNEGIHRRYGVLGWRQALRIGTGRQDAQITMTVGPEDTKLVLDVTLLSNGEQCGVEGAKKLFFRLRGNSATPEDPAVLATRRRDDAISIVQGALARPLATASYEDILALIEKGLVNLTKEDADPQLAELLFVLDKINVIDIKYGEARQKAAFDMTVSDERRRQELLDAEQKFALLEAEADMRRRQADVNKELADKENDLLIANKKALETAAYHEATARQVKLAPVMKVVHGLKSLGIADQAAFRLIGDVIDGSLPARRTPPVQLVDPDKTSELHVVTPEEAAARSAEAGQPVPDQTTPHEG